ncbi:hypothetical protein, partial [Nocardia cyriacigeorgica]|uniref:hypothetical protein n=1 Tax=Nocardia cyriacigeorgica TaxID=135487 RepID=UPI002455E10D
FKLPGTGSIYWRLGPLHRGRVPRTDGDTKLAADEVIASITRASELDGSAHAISTSQAHSPAQTEQRPCEA